MSTTTALSAGPQADTRQRWRFIAVLTGVAYAMFGGGLTATPGLILLGAGAHPHGA